MGSAGIRSAQEPVSVTEVSVVIALGLILILLAAGATVFAVVASGTVSTAIQLTGFGVTISATPLALFIAGALSVVMFAIGFALVTRGTRRTTKKRQELKRLRKDQATTETRPAGAGDRPAGQAPANPTSGASAPSATSARSDTGTAGSSHDSPSLGTYRGTDSRAQGTDS
jgi:membrane protein implicated in regulation of membrane protease activity